MISSSSEHSILNKEVFKITSSAQHPFSDAIIVEEPLEISIISGNGKARKKDKLAITMRTPGEDSNLAIGFLFTEAIIGRIQDVEKVTQVAENVIEISLHPQASFSLDQVNRHFYTSSSCGVCGKASLDLVKQHIVFSLQPNHPKIQFDQLSRIYHSIQDSQPLFQQTGGNHAVALLDSTGGTLYCAEDVGRHNAMDKVIGLALKEWAFPLANHIIVVSGRASFELVQKALMAGISILVAVGAPSSLAIELADAHGMTLIGFLKKDQANVYTGIERLD